MTSFFSGAEVFSRSFRAHFGQSPREFRSDFSTDRLHRFHPEFVQRLDRPTLLVYPVERRDPNNEKRATPSEGETLVAVVIGVPGSGTSTSSPDQVTYWLNAVAKRLWFPDFDTYGEEDDEY